MVEGRRKSFMMEDVRGMMDDVIPRHLAFYIYELTPSPTLHNRKMEEVRGKMEDVYKMDDV